MGLSVFLGTFDKVPENDVPRADNIFFLAHGSGSAELHLRGFLAAECPDPNPDCPHSREQRVGR
jgi:hypothetical protein